MICVSTSSLLRRLEKTVSIPKVWVEGVSLFRTDELL